MDDVFNLNPEGSTSNFSRPSVTKNSGLMAADQFKDLCVQLASLSSKMDHICTEITAMRKDIMILKRGLPNIVSSSTPGSNFNTSHREDFR